MASTCFVCRQLVRSCKVSVRQYHAIGSLRSSVVLAPLLKQHLPRRFMFSDALQNRIDQIMQRHEEVMKELNSSGRQSQANLGKELSSMSRVVALMNQKKALDEEESSIVDLLSEAKNASDKDLIQECETELNRLANEKQTLNVLIVDAIVPQDDDDYESDAVIEIRAGTGGDEASLFASELLETYIKTAKDLSWKIEVLSHSTTDIGGVREAAVEVSGYPNYRLPSSEAGDATSDNNSPLLGPFGAFKFESGVHRVQRVPVNDSRIHTSACSVAVLPSVSNSSNADELLPLSELRIETMRSSGAGGQHVNTTDSAVRITHLPTGITASIQDERSQHRNKEKAMKLVTARVRDRQREEDERRRGESRSALMGGGDRSERIRTYNYPQDRVTDHRSKVTKHGIEGLLNGGKDDGLVGTFLPALRMLRREELLNKLEEKNS